jgi:hypothetical protein
VSTYLLKTKRLALTFNFNLSLNTCGSPAVREGVREGEVGTPDGELKA